MTTTTGRADDPRTVLARTPMGRRRWAVVAVCVLLNGLDGYDILAIGMAAPGITREWGISRATLGVVLSAELVGMMLGSVVLGRVADRLGRRRVLLGALVVMGLGMLLASRAGDVRSLALVRMLTGLGIGGMIATANATVAEVSDDRRRATALALVAGGYPAGAALGGLVAARLLEGPGGWRSVFGVGALAAAALLPLVWSAVPESVGWLLHRRPAGALERVNRTLRAYGERGLDALPPAADDEAAPAARLLLRPPLRRPAVLLTAAYLLQLTTFYFLIKWIPGLVVDLGHSPAQAARVLVWVNVGALVGSALLALLSTRVPPRLLVGGAVLLSAPATAAVGALTGSLGVLTLAAAGANVLLTAAISGMYVLIASSFPSGLRAGATGTVMGLGRGGAALGPVLGGVLLGAGPALPVVTALMACGALLAAVSIAGLGELDLDRR